jgi:hypothetical protein
MIGDGGNRFGDKKSPIGGVEPFGTAARPSRNGAESDIGRRRNLSLSTECREYLQRLEHAVGR